MAEFCAYCASKHAVHRTSPPARWRGELAPKPPHLGSTPFGPGWVRTHASMRLRRVDHCPRRAQRGRASPPRSWPRQAQPGLMETFRQADTYLFLPPRAARNDHLGKAVEP